MRRFAWAPLARVAKPPIQYSRAAVPSSNDFATQFGVDRYTIYRWQKHGIPWFYADRIAIKVCGTHPGNIWPDWWDEA